MWVFTDLNALAASSLLALAFIGIGGDGDRVGVDVGRG